MHYAKRLRIFGDVWTIFTFCDVTNALIEQYCQSTSPETVPEKCIEWAQAKCALHAVIFIYYCYHHQQAAGSVSISDCIACSRFE